MTVSNKYILYLLVLHAAMAVMFYYLLLDTPWLILVAEGYLLLSAYVGYRIFHRLFAPLNLLSQGAAALEDQDFSVKLRPTGSFEMDRVVKVYNTMIEQLRSERVAGKQREEFLDQLVDAAELGVVVLTFDGEVDRMNDWMKRMCDSEPFRTAVLQPALHLSRNAAGLSRQRPDEPTGAATSGAVLTGPGNRRYHVEYATFIDRSFERGFLVIQDVTSELVTAERDAYGKVIRMMAHEVNNTNAAVASVLQTLLDTAREDGPDLKAITETYLPAVVNRTERLTEFMKNFARVARLPAPVKHAVDLNELANGAAALMRATLEARDIQLTLDLTATPVLVSADVSQLEQVIVNALRNAAQSIGSGGAIQLITTDHPASLVIADNGPGIPPEHAEAIFTPFFSTKPEGQGIGLTLSREILEAHGASYQLRTERDGWTRYRIVFG